MIDKFLKKIRIDIHKNSKLTFYLRGLGILLLPHFLYSKSLEDKYNKLSRQEKEIINNRVNYYNKIDHPFKPAPNEVTILDFMLKEKKKTYYFDLLEYLKYFNYSQKIAYLFGDIREIPPYPTIVKSRPIKGNNKNSILMKLNKVRHFIFIQDKLQFTQKKDKLVWRGKVHQKHRIAFFEKHFNNHLCDIGMVNNNKLPNQWKKEKLSLSQQLEYKFILAIEGNDVASNLKWILSSNSLVVMPKPKYETWFMEGKLQENIHYVLIKDDFSDLDEKLYYYMQNPEKAQKIINNAHMFIQQFLNQEYEDIISYMVLKKYFDLKIKLFHQ